MRNFEEEEYLELLHYVMTRGEIRDQERTGTGTRSVFHTSLRFELEAGYPLLTTKKVNFKAVLSELLWFLEGSDDERRLAEIHYGKDRKELIGKKTIWTANADEQGVNLGYENNDLVKKLGTVYGVQWRKFSEVDQIETLINGLKNNPQSRRHLLSAWNVGELENMALPPCHTFAQFYVTNDKRLNCTMYQRSADLILGVPFNIASNSLLVYMIAENEYLLVVNASNIEKDWNWISSHNSFGVEMNNVSDDWSLLAVQGPDANKVLQQLTMFGVMEIK